MISRGMAGTLSLGIDRLDAIAGEARELAQVETVLKGVGCSILAIAAVSLAWSYGRGPPKSR